jgi:hypothetical protein
MNTTYISSLSDSILDNPLQAAENLLETALDGVERSAGTTVQSVIQSGERAVTTAVDGVLNPQTAPVRQQAETQVSPAIPTRTQPTTRTIAGPGSPLSGDNLKKLAIPAAAAAGVWFWKKSIVWSAGAAAAAWFVANKMKKTGAA